MNIVVDTGDDERDVAVDVTAPTARVRDLVDELVRLGGWPPDAEGLTVDGRRVAGGTPLGDVGLEEGVTVAPTPPGTAPPPTAPDHDPATGATHVLTVVAGPLTGRQVPLPAAGTVRLGRDPTAAGAIVLADPTISACHAEVRLRRGAVAVADAGSCNGTWLGGEPVDGVGRVLEPGDTVRLGATVLRLDVPPPDDRPRVRPPVVDGRRPFNRPPRTTGRAAEDPLPVPAEPPEPAPPRGINVMAVLAPLAMGAAMIVMTGQPRFALFALLSPITALGSWLGGRRQARRDAGRRATEQAAAVTALAETLCERAADERRRREAALPDVAEILRRAAAPSVTLWERRPTHDDVLRLRIGTGTVAWDPPVDVPRDGPATAAAEVLATHANLADVPVPVDLADAGIVGIAGPRGPAVALARSLLCQAAVLHGPADLAVNVCTSAATVDDWAWAAWLPHTRRPDGGRRLAGTPADAARVLGDLPAEDGAPTHLLVIDDEHLLTGRDAVGREVLVRSPGRPAGIVVAATPDALPATCTTVVVIDDELGTATVRHPAAATATDGVATAGTTVATARRCARALARFDDPEAGDDGGRLPADVRLLDLLGFGDDLPSAVARAWQDATPTARPTVPLGVGAGGAPVVVDLAADGPHALVAGTTGAGKSELVRTLVAGLAARTDPDRLTFVLVDYKGGSAFDELARLPHVVGLVTDLDERLGERALRSLHAELRYREQRLRDAGAADLPAYLAAGAPHGPLPRLVLVVDEFAALAAELPDLLDALVGIAQRGRSLGVHLILATQRPRGVVGADVRANTDLRIALRVQDPADSVDVIDDPAAAAIARTTPGRAWLRRGPGDRVAVQTARISGTATADTRPVRVAPLRFGPDVSDPSTDVDAHPADPDDLTRLVDACVAAFGDRRPPRRPWLPDLPARLPLAGLLDRSTTPDDHAGIPIGVIDRPDEQSQPPLRWDPADGHLAFFGTAGSGTTTALLTVARAVTARHGPDSLHLYGVDLDGGGLTALTGLPHTGTVSGPGDDPADRARLVRYLRSEIDRRRRLGGSPAVTCPRLVLLVDGVGALLAEHGGTGGFEDLERILADGPTVGISAVLAGARHADLPLRLQARIGQRLLLRHADPHDLAVAGVRPERLPAHVPGRGVTVTGDPVQIAHPGDVTAWSGTVRAVPVQPPRHVGRFPDDLPHDRLPAPSVDGDTITLPVGLAEADLAPLSLTLHRGEHLLVAGPARSGRTTTLRLLSSQLRFARPDLVQIALCDAVRSDLARWPSLDGAGSLATFAPALRAILADDSRDAVVLVDDALHVDDVDGVLADVLAAGRAGLHVIAAGHAGTIRGAHGHWLQSVRRCGVAVLLQPEPTDGDLFSARLPRHVPVPPRPGRGYLIRGGTGALLQVAHPPAAPPAGSVVTTREAEHGAA